MQLYDALHEEDLQVRVFPDGRPLIDQPVKLLRAFSVLRRIYAERR